MNYTRRTRRNEYYLDVSDFVLSDARQVIPSPRRTPIPIHQTDVKTKFIYWCRSLNVGYSSVFIFTS